MININMMGNKVFNEDQIEKLIQTEIRKRGVSYEDELKAARLSRGAPTADQQAFIDKVDTRIAEAIADFTQMRADCALLSQVLRYEGAARTLAKPALDPNATDENGDPLYPIDPETGVNAHIEVDTVARAEAQAIIDAATQDVLDIVSARIAAQSA